MYLSVSKTFQLDEIIKSFEVALRSFIADTLLDKFKIELDFKNAIDKLELESKTASVIFSHKNTAKIKKMSSNVGKHYMTINDCYLSYTQNKFNNDVPYVSDLIDYISLFFNDCFSDKNLIKDFNSVEEFYYNCSLFLRLRNSMSHPASTKVLTNDAGIVLVFLRRLSANIDDGFFWYVSKDDILKKISEFQIGNPEAALKVDNLKNGVNYHKKIVCRDDELAKLTEYIIGRDSYYRIAGSVVLFGYGGVGKTALVVDFLYDLIRKLKDDSNLHPADFILFYSSKDEYLRQNITTGELYIDNIKRQIDGFESFKSLLLSDLGIEKIEQVRDKYKGGIVVIDNIENLEETEKEQILKLIKETPREIQYIITSRNEEQCEEKIHIKEFRDHDKGQRFISEYIETEGLDVVLDEHKAKELIDSSKGNTLILVQSLIGLNEGSISFEEIISNLENIKSKSVEIIADFMYKNTFERSIFELEDQKYDPKSIIKIMSLYEEPIDLYSISKLAKVDIGSSEAVCRYLAKKLILNKSGEYYSVNEFANSFIFIKLMPSDYETKALRANIRDHKIRMSEKLESLKIKCRGNSKINNIMDDWKPRNYIDKIVIAEAFDIYDRMVTAVKDKDKQIIEKLLSELSTNELVTNHPYIQFQKARIYRQCLDLFNGEERNKLIKIISRCYDDAIESIHFSHQFIRGTNSHGAVLMLYGIFLGSKLKDHSRAIRYLEEASVIFGPQGSKNYFSTLYYLSMNYLSKYRETNDDAYRHKLQKSVRSVLSNKSQAKRTGFKVESFAASFSSYL